MRVHLLQQCAVRDIQTIFESFPTCNSSLSGNALKTFKENLWNSGLDDCGNVLRLEEGNYNDNTLVSHAG